MGKEPEIWPVSQPFSSAAAVQDPRRQPIDFILACFLTVGKCWRYRSQGSMGIPACISSETCFQKEKLEYFE